MLRRLEFKRTLRRFAKIQDINEKWLSYNLQKKKIYHREEIFNLYLSNFLKKMITCSKYWQQVFYSIISIYGQYFQILPP